MIVYTVWFLDCGELAYHPAVTVQPPHVLAVYATLEDAEEAAEEWRRDQQPCEVRQMVLDAASAGGHPLKRDSGLQARSEREVDG